MRVQCRIRDARSVISVVKLGINVIHAWPPVIEPRQSGGNGGASRYAYRATDRSAVGTSGGTPAIWSAITRAAPQAMVHPSVP